jgi:protein O-GlcNAc transferase
MGRTKIRHSERAPRLQSNPQRSIDQEFALALQYHSAGRIEEAKRMYIRVLERRPDHADALHNAGTIAFGAGDCELGICFSERAVALCPRSALFRTALATALNGAGCHDRAAAEFKEALRLDPNYVEAWYNFGYSLRTRGLWQEAIACFERTIALAPKHPHARTNLGLVYVLTGRLEDAAACFRQVITEQPAGFMALNNLAIVLVRQENSAEAEELLHKIIQLHPDRLQPRITLSEVLLSTQRFGEAVECLEQWTRLISNEAELFMNLGRAYAAQGRFEECLRSVRQGLALQPKLPIAHEMALFALHYSPDLTPLALAAEHRIWAASHADSLFPSHHHHANHPDPERTLRVGYVSADFHQHPVAFFMAPVLAAHDRSRFEVVCYASGRDDDWTERLRAPAAMWRETDGLGDAEIAQLIEQDRIDILIDLSGHTGGNRLLVFARKPAPVQVSWLGYFNTTGMRAMDYLVVDSHLAPLEEEHPFVEEPLRIPGCYLCYKIPEYAPAVAPAPCVERGFVTYGCFNALAKIGSHVVTVWAEVLRRNPTARLVMRNRAFSDETSRHVYLQQFERCGIDCERLDLLGGSSHQEILQFYSEIDIALDPFPYNGGTTTCEALAMGVPVVTLRGDRFVSRVAATVLSNAGLEELIAQSEAEYVDKAVALAENPERLVTRRATIRTRLAASAVCDADGFTRKLENAYRNIWRRWCDQQKAS